MFVEQPMALPGSANYMLAYNYLVRKAHFFFFTEAGLRQTRALFVLNSETGWTGKLSVNCVCPSVCPSVCPRVCLFTFEVPFNGIFAPFPEVGCPIFLEIRNPWEN